MPAAIVTDTTCDLSRDEALRLGIDLVPILVRFGDRTYHDGVDLSLREFYAKLDPGGDLPTTQPPPPEDFEAVFRRHVDAGREVVVPVVSAAMSKIYDAASAAAAKFPGKVHVIDGKTLSGGMGLLASLAARLAREGVPAREIVAALHAATARQTGFAIYPDLKFLQKSGRINRAQLILGTVMHVVPVTRVSASGTLEGETTVKSWDQAKDMVANVAARKIGDPTKTRVIITHTHDPQLGDFVAEALKRRLTAPLRELSIHEAGPTIGANVGPGAAGIFMLPE